MKIKLLGAARAAASLRFLLTALLLGAPATAPTANDADAPTVSVSNAWARATPPGIPVGAAYFTITNHGNHPDTLVSVASPVAARVELHRTTVDNGISRMRPAGPIFIAPARSLEVETGGLHAMLMDLTTPLIAGTHVPLVLTFRTAGAVTVQMHVQPATFVSHEAQAGH